jgi:DNA polymerase III subunit gamma/tau
MSLYRTYRPKAFDDVVGQDHIVSTLLQAVEQDKLTHAYLFAGTRGTGKTTVARILSKILLTRGIKDKKIKEQVEQSVDEGTLVDLTEIDAASNRGIDDIRSLLEKIQFTPVVAGAKVYIIDEVHMLTREAFNALLKTLEEPPPYAYFILATTELHKIPATIQSRCQRFLFRQINETDIVGRLRFIADQEKIAVDDDALRAMAHHVQGAMRDAISLLDQLRSLPKITLADVKDRVGETGHEYVDAVLAALESGNREVILLTVRKLEETGVPLENFIRLLLDAVRMQIHKAVEHGQSTALYEPMLDALLQTVKDLRSAPVPGLVLESALLALCKHAAHLPPPPAMTTLAIQKPAMPKAGPVIESTIPAASQPTPVSSAVTLEQLRAGWNDIVRQVKPAAAKMSLKDGQVHSVEGNVITLRFSSGFHREKANAAEALHNLESILRTTFGQPLVVKSVLESEIHSPPPIAQDDAVNLAEAALEVF